MKKNDIVFNISFMWLICLLGCKAVSARERQIPNSKLHPEVSYTGTFIIVEELLEKRLCVFYVPRETNINLLLTLSIGSQEEGYSWELAKWSTNEEIKINQSGEIITWYWGLRG